MTDRRITIIAEIGINHNGNMDLARQMIYEAKKAGADIAKFQIYIPERILDLDHPGIKKHWDTIKATELSLGNVCYLKGVCDLTGIEFMASVFHPDRVKWTEGIGMKQYKIASRSIYDKVLAEAVAATGKPIILSWGYHEPVRSWPAITKWSKAWAQTKHLYCVSKYPAALSDLDLSIHTFAKGNYAGFSDHTMGITASVAAMYLGATIIEKHFTLDRAMSGFDHAWSIEPDELRQLCDMRNDIEEML